MRTIGIHWFRRDLRLADNPALSAARRCDRLIPLYIHDPAGSAFSVPGSAAAWWLHESLTVLQERLRERGGDLVFRSGPITEVLLELVRRTGATMLFWNRLYEPRWLECDRAVVQALAGKGVVCRVFHGDTLVEPGTLLTRTGAPFQVFTPFWRECRRRLEVPALLPQPRTLPPPPARLRRGRLSSLRLLSAYPWYRKLASYWEPGEPAARRRLGQFLRGGLAQYGSRRDIPAAVGTSRLSAPLHFGELSPAQLYEKLFRAGPARQVEAWLRQLGWREFARHLLFHFPHTESQPLRERFERFPWRRRYARDLDCWRRGLTGVPLVDAGMRELWETGWMHNRVRMVAASFLTKNLLIPWQEGARWFEHTLVDADLANNTLGWQWVAGCGADAAPYFRVFNPLRQAERFDPDGDYIRRWVPELAGLPGKQVLHPWGRVRDYPEPIVDLIASRNAALRAYDKIRG